MEDGDLIDEGTQMEDGDWKCCMRLGWLEILVWFAIDEVEGIDFLDGGP